MKKLLYWSPYIPIIGIVSVLVSPLSRKYRTCVEDGHLVATSAVQGTSVALLFMLTT